MRLLLFAGTKNGRELALTMAEEGYEVYVSSASAYGDSLLAVHESIHSIYGKLEVEGIVDLILKEGIECVVDCTHPYAANISKNLLLVSSIAALPLIRFEREHAIPNEVGHHFSSMTAACAYLRKCRGNILFTTGVNDLSNIIKGLDRERVYARILPIESSMNQAMTAGLSKSQMIAHNPPFTLQENLEHIHQFNIEYLVTKDGGKEGNIEEKLVAVSRCGIALIVIDRPKIHYEHIGYTIEEILEEVKKIPKPLEKY